ncbi:RNHCP domain-containing protein [Ornithinibacillus contaminans]|uniref:RNHCP domain-containing protein n=1 Tax=Ornithinibacillus contaminans TaxID=694055 RepID=UPI0009F981CD|nr:RNHCP domain-containing protein [Ornithinibacillus contaminans]
MGRRREENTSFICENCSLEVLPLTNGSYRNHCPHCLYSKHLDDKPGDRSSTCGGMMMPIDISYNAKKGYQIVHQCLKCKAEKKNKVAVDSIQPDNIMYYYQQLV